jgi:hypothetical protein
MIRTFMALALEADHFRNGSKAAIRIAKSYVRYQTGSWVQPCTVRPCTACAGAHPIDEILADTPALAGMTAAVHVHS